MPIAERLSLLDFAGRVMPFTSKQSGAQNGNQNARKDKGQTEGQASPPANGGTNESSTQPQARRRMNRARSLRSHHLLTRPAPRSPPAM
eukprot:5361946-Prymnesium_polylepis.1